MEEYNRRMPTIVVWKKQRSGEAHVAVAKCHRYIEDIRNIMDRGRTNTRAGDARGSDERRNEFQLIRKASTGTFGFHFGATIRSPWRVSGRAPAI
jgi:hypothetical protein